jgi:hypothetical protein
MKNGNGGKGDVSCLILHHWENFSANFVFVDAACNEMVAILPVEDVRSF